MSLFTKILLPQDKANHVVWGSIASSVTILVCVLLVLFTSLHISVSWAFGILVATVLALGKDYIWDKLMGRGTFDPMDIVATVLGGLIPAAPGALFYFISK